MVWTNFIVNYVVLVFHIIGVHHTWRIWGSVGYWPNILVVAGSLLGPFVLPKPRRSGKEAAAPGGGGARQGKQGQEGKDGEGGQGLQGGGGKAD